MRIVVLDGEALNPGDLSWQGLGALGEYTVHARTGPEELSARAAGADAVLTNKVRLSGATLRALRPALRYVGITATGVDAVDLDAARALGIAVCNVPSYATASVAQHTIALLLALTNHVAHSAQRVRQGAWSGSGRFAYWEQPPRELAGLRLGVVGFGDIGAAVADLALALGMRVAATGRRPPAVAGRPVEVLPLPELLARCDVVSLHCPLTDATRGMIDGPALARMRPDALLLNTARGALIDEAALAAALHAGALGGVGLDVLSVEPPPLDHPLLSAPRCLITGHSAWASRAARGRLLGQCVDNLAAFVAGRPTNRVA